MRTIGTAAFTLVVTVLAGAAPAYAQTSQRNPGWLRVEGQFGKLGFVEAGDMDHLVLGAGARFALTRSLAIGPDVTYLRGPGTDRDVLALAMLNVDLRSATDGRSRVQPYFLAGAGYARHREQFGSFSDVRQGMLIDLGLGARVAAGERWYIAPEVRFGWEAHIRIGVAVGWQ